MIDTNIWYSGLLHGGKPEKALRHALIHQQPIVSDYIVGELLHLLGRLSPKPPHRWLKQLREKLLALTYDDHLTTDFPGEIRDIKDEPIVRLAANHQAVILTGDRDLLEFRGPGIPATLTVDEYIELFIGN